MTQRSIIPFPAERVRHQPKTPPVDQAHDDAVRLEMLSEVEAELGKRFANLGESVREVLAGLRNKYK